jgi:cobaltochelatase CobS
MEHTTEISVRAFGFESDQTLPGMDLAAVTKLAEFIPQKREEHVFSKREFIIFRAWWQNDSGDPLYIMGPTGCGKTSFVRQFAARANYPLIELTGRPNLEKSDLVGSYVLKADGAMHWIDGPAVRAWRHGAILLINEFTACDPSFWVANNEMLEGESIFLEQTGELIRRHPNARIVLTDNTKGLVGDETGLYQGRFRQDPSVMDRMWKMSMDYMPEAEEIKLLKQGMPPFGDDPMTSEKLQDAFAKTLRNIAVQVRQAFMGASKDNDAIEATLSTRTLLRFRDLMITLKDGAKFGFDPVKDALDIALTSMCDETTRQVIHKIAQLELGNGPTANLAGES